MLGVANWFPNQGWKTRSFDRSNKRPHDLLLHGCESRISDELDRDHVHRLSSV
jgi:hypothetical protein